MNDEVPLPPYRFAGLVAPAIERVVTGVLRACEDNGTAELCQRYGGATATGFLVEFRTRLAAPGGTVSGAGFAAVTRYRDPAVCQRSLDKQVAHAMLHRRQDGGFLATDRGASFLAEVFALHARITRELWAAHLERVIRLVDLTGRITTAALAEVAERDEPAENAGFATMAPAYEPDGAPPGVLLLNRLDTLRHHRADLHAAAWLAAGHNARSIVDLPAGPERLAIEQETDRRAAGPYTALNPTERLLFLADLAALPGT